MCGGGGGGGVISSILHMLSLRCLLDANGNVAMYEGSRIYIRLEVKGGAQGREFTELLIYRWG